MARDALALLAAEGIERPIVMGHSMGGMVAMRLAALEPELPRAVVLVDVGPEVSQRGAEAIRNFVTRNVEFEHLDEFIDRVAAYDPLPLPRAHGAHRPLQPRPALRRPLRQQVRPPAARPGVPQPPRTPAGRVPAADAADGFHRYPGPTLLVRGERSNILEAEAAARFAESLPGAELVEVPDCGHNVHSQNTPGFIEAVAPFLEAAAAG